LFTLDPHEDGGDEDDIPGVCHDRAGRWEKDVSKPVTNDAKTQLVQRSLGAKLAEVFASAPLLRITEIQPANLNTGGVHDCAWGLSDVAQRAAARMASQRCSGVRQLNAAAKPFQSMRCASVNQSARAGWIAASMAFR